MRDRGDTGKPLFDRVILDGRFLPAVRNVPR